MALAICEFVIIIILTLILLYRSKTKICRSKQRLDGKTCLVTGGTSGIGLEVAIDFAMRGARVIVTGLFDEEGKNAEAAIIKESGNSNVVFKLVNYASLKSVRKFAAEILKTEERLDILMNNVGSSSQTRKTEDGVDFIMQVNYLSHFLLTMILLPLLIKSGRNSSPSRIVNTTSIVHSYAKLDVTDDFLTSDKMSSSLTLLKNNYRYRNSKLCLMLFSHTLSQKLKPFNVVINSADPGAVFTNLFQGSVTAYMLYILMWCIGKSPYEGAQTLIHVAVDENAGRVSGRYFAECGLLQPSKSSCDDNLAKKLWDESVTTVNLEEEHVKFELN